MRLTGACSPAAVPGRPGRNRRRRGSSSTSIAESQPVILQTRSSSDRGRTPGRPTSSSMRSMSIQARHAHASCPRGCAMVRLNACGRGARRVARILRAPRAGSCRAPARERFAQALPAPVPSGAATACKRPRSAARRTAAAAAGALRPAPRPPAAARRAGWRSRSSGSPPDAPRSGSTVVAAPRHSRSPTVQERNATGAVPCAGARREFACEQRLQVDRRQLAGTQQRAASSMTASSEGAAAVFPRPCQSQSGASSK